MNNLTNERLEEMRHYGADIAEIIDRLFVAEKRLAETQQSYKVACALHTKSAQALAALEKQEPDLYLCPVTRGGEKLFSQCGRDYPRGRGYYSRSVPQPVSQPIIVTDDMAMAFHRATTDGDVGSDDVSDIKIGLKAALCNISTAQPYTLPDEWTYNDAVQFVLINGMSNETRAGIAMHVFNHCRAAMLQSGNSPVWSGVDKVNSPVIPDGSVPEGYALVPGTIYLDESDIESICSQCGDGGGNYGDFTRGILWVGDIQDDEGNITHGLHISSDDYPEEGGITLAKFSAAPQHKAG